jgi:hypothetical protein
MTSIKKLSIITRQQYLFIFGTLCASRLFIYYVLNITPNFLPSGQLINFNLLQNNLFESIYYLHFQPFLWNLFYGLVAKFFNSNLLVLNTFFLLNIFYTFLIIYYFSKIAEIIKIHKAVQIIIVFFIILNPNIVFYEHYSPHYAQFTAMMIFQLMFFFLKFLHSKEIKYEIFCYLNLLILSFVWVLFNFLVFFLFFIFFRLYEKKLTKKNFIILFLFIGISIIPMIKNKIVFNIFSAGSWSGIQVGMTVHDHEAICAVGAYQIGGQTNRKTVEREEKNYRILFNRNLNNKYVSGYKAQNNNVGLIYRSKKCLEWSINKIHQDPIAHLKRISNFFFASHSKFSFEHDLKPNNWTWNFRDNSKLVKIKIYKQLLLLVYMLILYFFLIKQIFLGSNKNPEKYFFAIIFFLNVYLVGVSHFFAGVEAERMMHTLFVNHCLFLGYILSYLRKKIFKN